MKILRIIVFVLISSLFCFGVPSTLQERGVQTGITPHNQVDFKVNPDNQHALIIGINEYSRLDDLKNAVLDARELKKLLIERYHYKEENIQDLYNENATRVNIHSKLRWFTKTLTSADSLLVYFSGHGHLDKLLVNGSWLPTDLGMDLPNVEEIDKEEMVNISANKIGNELIKGLMRNCKAKHIFIVADSCFSASLIYRGREKNADGYLNYSSKASRQVLASGRKSVADGIPGEHSPFAKYFLKYLKDNTDRVIIAQKIIGDVMTSVSRNSDQNPLGGPADDVGDEGGQFFFNFAYYKEIEEIKKKKEKLFGLLETKPDRKIKLKMCKKFLRDLGSFPESSLINEYKAETLKKVKNIESEISIIKKMGDEFNKLDKLMQTGTISSVELFKRNEDLLENFKNAPNDLEVKAMRNRIQSGIVLFIHEEMQKGFKALVEVVEDENIKISDKIRQCTAFVDKYEPVNFTERSNDILQKAKKMLDKLKKCLKSEGESIIKDENLSYNEKIVELRKFLSENDAVLSGDIKQKIEKEVMVLIKKEKDFKRKQGDIDYRRIMNDISLEEYLKFKKKYPQSLNVDDLRKLLVQKYPTLPPQKYWESLKGRGPNSNGYWEGEFANHVMVYVPELKVFMDKYEVSISLLSLMMDKVSIGNNIPILEEVGDDCPCCLSFEQAKKYCEKLNRVYTHLHFRLPTKEEWEIAAGRKKEHIYPWGNQEVDEDGAYRANFDDSMYFRDGFEFLAPVKSFEEYVSPYGIFNMSGNVWEWVCGEDGIECKGGSYLSKKENLKISATSRSENMVGFRCMMSVEND